MPTPPDRGKLAAKGKPLSARQLNEIQAQAADLGRLDLQGGTFSGGTQFTPDQPKTFYAKITAVGTGGWHSWQKVIWNAATGTFINPPSPAMKGHKDTNGAYALGGGSGTVGDVVELKLFGARKVSSLLHPVYSFTRIPSASANPWGDGTLVMLRYNGGTYDTYTSSGATTFDTLTPNGSGGFTVGTAAVQNRNTGPLFHAATNGARTSWAPVGTGTTPTMIGIRQTSLDTITNYVQTPVFFPARFRRNAALVYGTDDPWREVEFSIRTPGALSGGGSWYLLQKDPSNYGSVGRLLEFWNNEYTLYNTGGTYYLGSTTRKSITFETENNNFMPWTLGNNYIDGTVGYTPDAGWFAAAVATGAKPQQDGAPNMRWTYLIYNQQLIYNGIQSTTFG